MRAWLLREVSGSLEDDKVPHVGPATIDKLHEAGITTTFELIGRLFLEIDADAGPQEACDRYKAMLHAAGCAPAHLDSVVTAVLAKAASGTFKCPCQMSAERLASSRMDWDKMKKFLATPLTGDLIQDLMGVGKASMKGLAELDPDTEVEGYEAAEGGPITVGQMTGLTTGVTTTWQLLGMGIVCKDADMFEALLKTAGVATGFRATVVHQVVERLNAGIKVPGLASAC